MQCYMSIRVCIVLHIVWDLPFNKAEGLGHFKLLSPEENINKVLLITEVSLLLKYASVLRFVSQTNTDEYSTTCLV